MYIYVKYVKIHDIYIYIYIYIYQLSKTKKIIMKVYVLKKRHATVLMFNGFPQLLKCTGYKLKALLKMRS